MNSDLLEALVKLENMVEDIPSIQEETQPKPIAALGEERRLKNKRTLSGAKLEKVVADLVLKVFNTSASSFDLSWTINSIINHINSLKKYDSSRDRRRSGRSDKSSQTCNKRRNRGCPIVEAGEKCRKKNGRNIPETRDPHIKLLRRNGGRNQGKRNNRGQDVLPTSQSSRSPTPEPIVIVD